MYLNYFGLDESPFSITPDPSFIYLSSRHRDALAHLLYGVGKGGSGGFVQLTGEVGTGKTTLCRALLEQVPEGTHIALVLNPLMNPLEMLAAVCEELGIDTVGAEGSSKLLVDRLNRYLLDVHAREERVVLVIDEAQNLSPESLEQVRLLTNLETRKEKLLQIILLGQPELRELLRRRSLRQLAQRITARYHLTPLSVEDTGRYVAHRMAVAGAGRNPFTRSGHKALFRRSLGVPRLINIIADRALAAAYAADRGKIDKRLVNAAADEVQQGEPRVRAPSWHRWVAAAVFVVSVTALLWAITWGDALDPPDADEDIVTAPEQPSSRPDVMPEAPSPVTTEPAQQSETTVSTSDIPAVDTFSPGTRWFEEQSLRAWQTLASAWGRPEDSALVEASCRGSQGLGYACIRDQGNWRRIQQLGLPVVLVLPGPSQRFVLLSGMDGDQLQVGPEDEVVRRSDIEDHWFGDYFIAWPQAPDWPQEIRRGDQGSAVDTVVRLARTTDEPYAGTDGFGPDFEGWLRTFQSSQGLEVDGIVGPKTLLYLMRHSIDEPRLATALGTES